MIAGGSPHLCLECGLCCNGVIFANVQLQPEDDTKKLQSLGLTPVRRNGRPAGTKFPQPCAAFGGDCRCRIYPDRPKYCQEFECLLLKSVMAGKTEPAAALSIVRTARRRVEKVKRLLRKLGDADEQVPLSARVRRTQKRLEKETQDQPRADMFGQLTLAAHDLTMLLSDAFYSGPGGETISSR